MTNRLKPYDGAAWIVFLAQNDLIEPGDEVVDTVERMARSHDLYDLLPPRNVHGEGQDDPFHAPADE